MNRKRFHIIAALVPLALSATILIVLFSRAPLPDVFAVVMDSRAEFIVPALILSLSVNILLGARKWQFILGAMDCRLPYGEILALRTGCIPFKMLLPMKSSEFIKAVYLSRHAKLPFIETVGSLLIDKAMNLAVVLVVLACGLAFADIHAALWLPAIFLFSIASLLFTRSFRGFLIRATENIHPRLHASAKRLLGAFERISGRDRRVVLGYSIVYQLSEFVNTWLLFRAVGVSLPLSTIMVWVPVIMIVNNLPIAILGIGTREAGMLFAFARFGSEAALLGGGLLVSLVEHILPVIIGLFFIHGLLRYYQAGMNAPP